MMTSVHRPWRILAALTLIGSFGTTTAAVAQSASSTSEGQGATTGLGTHHRFPTAAAAKAHCPDDTIVWSNGSSMTYRTASSGPSGAAHQGFYACKMEADSAGFHRAD
jgi:hypothetical protein